MKDEIKEINITFPGQILDYVDTKEHLLDLFNYITNLQEELEDLREDNYAYHQLMKMQNKREYRSKFLKEFQQEYDTNTFPDYDEIYKRYDKMKSKIDKATNKIQYIIDYGFDYDGLNTVESLKGLIDMLVDYARKSKNILQGSDEVEILEEEKIPEKIKIEQDTPSSNYYIRNENGTKCGLTKHSKMIVETLNQVIDYLKSKGE